jgi:hypothetical protein
MVKHSEQYLIHTLAFDWYEPDQSSSSSEWRRALSRRTFAWSFASDTINALADFRSVGLFKGKSGFKQCVDSLLRKAIEYSKESNCCTNQAFHKAFVELKSSVVEDINNNVRDFLSSNE